MGMGLGHGLRRGRRGRGMCPGLLAPARLWGLGITPQYRSVPVTTFEPTTVGWPAPSTEVPRS